MIRFCRSSLPALDALRALGVQAGVPRAGWLRGPVVSVAAHGVLAEEGALLVVCGRDPLPETNAAVVSALVAADGYVLRDVVTVGVLRVVLDRLGEAGRDGLLFRGAHELEAPLHRVVDRVLLRRALQFRLRVVHTDVVGEDDGA